jgi:hypothetical protein
MTTRLFKSGIFFCVTVGLAMTTVLTIPTSTVAKDGDHNRTRFYGWVESIPNGFQGPWMIGGQQITTTPQTELDQKDGPLMVGTCAKVDIRNNMVHEIDSEPPEDCR